MLSAYVDLTVRVRVQWTSRDRPDDDDLADFRGSDRFRLGTGFIRECSGPRREEPCPCRECDGKVAKEHWTFTVQTAWHVVYDTEEASKAKVDLFYDDQDSLPERVRTVWSVKAVWCNSKWDICQLLCVTHDQALAERVSSLLACWSPLRGYSIYTPEKRGLLDSIRTRCGSDQDGEESDRTLAVIVSHPHGQPKRVTVGRWILPGARDSVGRSGLEYHTATCPGSSGAPVLLIHPALLTSGHFTPWSGPVHSGSYSRASTGVSHPVNYSNSLNHI